MLEQVARRLYERLGARYKLVFVATQIPSGMLVAVGFVGILASFYRPTTGEFLTIAGMAAVFTAFGVAYSMVRQRPEIVALAGWRTLGDPTPEETIAAWEAATNFPMRAFRANSVATNAIAAVPSAVAIALILDLSWSAIPVILGAAGLAAAYGTIVSYAITEFLVRPVVSEIAAALPDDFPFTRGGLPVRKRLMITLPTFTATAGIVVAALVTDHGGTRMLAISVAVALVVGFAVSHELTVLLSQSITGPIGDLRVAMARVRAGEYAARVPVTSNDDLGDLAAAFNGMARGLEEREQIRDAFGTYLDRDVANLVLSGQFPEDGVEVDVTVMFCDVPGFTPYAEQVSAREVVSSLNAMFERVVPIVQKHGGHVDKFMGDGLLAVFGAPEGYADHADRALAAGREILASQNGEGLQLCVGLNSGPVVAGAIGGAGRLNFSVIGDTVNVAARVEAATRTTEDDLLLTRSTRDALVTPVPLVSRGSIALKGKAAPAELFAPAPDARPPQPTVDEAAGVTR